MSVELNQSAIAALGRSASMSALLDNVAERVATQARRNVTGHFPGTARAEGIAVVSGVDQVSAHADVGYLRNHPGFVLWWSEVGTRKMSPRPHLRVALQQVRL